MKRKILVKIAGVIFALNIFSSSIVLAKEQEKKVEGQGKELSEKEQKKKEIETIKKCLKKEKELDEKTQIELKQMFKNFKQKDFEDKNYDLEVLEKNGAYLLFYTHKKTGAQVYFNLSLDKEKIKQKNFEINFRAPSKDDSGLVHFSEHCLASPILMYFLEKLEIDSGNFNAHTTFNGLNVVIKENVFKLNKNLEKEFIEKFSKDFKNPPVFEKGNKTFEIEKKRILNEIKDKKGNDMFIEMFLNLYLRNFKFGGEISKLEKVSLKDFKRFYEKYIHPSNCLILKNVSNLNSKFIKNYLNLWHENYFKHFNKKEIKDAKYELKNKEKYLFHSWPKDSSKFKDLDKEEKVKSYKYVGYLEFNLKGLNSVEKAVLNFDLKSNFEEEIQRFAKRLGYGKIRVLKDGKLHFFGNNKELFKQKVLEENSKKVMSFVANKLKGLNEEDFLSARYSYYANYNKNDMENIKKEEVFSNPERYLNYSIIDLIKKSFNETGKAFSNKFFIINKNNEIESSLEKTDEYIKQNFDIYNKIAEKGPETIDVFEKSDKTLKQTYSKDLEKYEYLCRVIPIKLKQKNKQDDFVADFSKQLLANFLSKELNHNQGLVYGSLAFLNYIKNYFVGCYSLNKDSVNKFENYVAKNFNEIMKKVKITKKDLDDFKKQFKENFKAFQVAYKEFIKLENKYMKDIQNYVKTKKFEENSSIKKDLLIKNIFSVCSNYMDVVSLTELILSLAVDYENDEYQAFFEKKMNFIEKYKKDRDKKINPEVMEDFLKDVFIPTIENFKNAFKKAEKKLKVLDSITLKDVTDLIKTAYLVEDKNEIEKANKNLNHFQKQEKIFDLFFFAF